jgi:starch synthase
MASGVRFADKVFTVSPSYARQIEEACDGLEVLLHDVIGISNAIGSDFVDRIRKRFEESGLVEEVYPCLLEKAGEDVSLRKKLEARYPEILEGPRCCETIPNRRRRRILTRMRNKLLIQIRSGFDADPDRVLFSMIHRVAEQKGYQLLLEASQGVFRDLGFQGIVGGQVASGDQRGEELIRGLLQLADYYRGEVSVSVGFQDVSLPLLSSDVFVMPSLHEPGGISQLEAMACGCLIVARATGGLRDTVTPLRKRRRSLIGNGFLFSDFTAWSFYDAMNRCAVFFREASDEEIFRARRNAERAAFFWDRPARQYIERLYGIKEIIRPM